MNEHAVGASDTYYRVIPWSPLKYELQSSDPTPLPVLSVALAWQERWHGGLLGLDKVSQHFPTPGFV